MTQKVIVFDFGGVLFQTSATAFYRDRFLKNGKSEQELHYFLDHVFTAKDRSAANSGTMQVVIERKVLEHPEWADDIRAFGAERDFVEQVRGVIPGMQSVLSDLTAQGYKIVGLTNWAADTYDVLPRAFPDVLKHFNDVVVSGKVGIKKPSPDIFHHAQKAFGNPKPSDVYYFDDKLANVEAARASIGWNGFVFEDAETVRKALSLTPKI